MEKYAMIDKLGEKNPAKLPVCNICMLQFVPWNKTEKRQKKIILWKTKSSFL